MPTSMNRTVFVSGCFDLLHSGHIAFLETAAEHGRLVVSVASDRTVLELKGRAAIYLELERVYLVRALRCVSEAFIAEGAGMLDFEAAVRRLRPERFVVNFDGDQAAKRRLCQEIGIDYIVLPRTPIPHLPERSSSSIRASVVAAAQQDEGGTTTPSR